MANIPIDISYLDTLDEDKLREELSKAKTEFFNLRFAKASGTLENNQRIKMVRKSIARINTIARERELGFRTLPSVQEN